jgi:hypothetical protein
MKYDGNDEQLLSTAFKTHYLISLWLFSLVSDRDKVPKKGSCVILYKGATDE